MTKFDPHKNFAVSVIAAGPSPALSGTSLTLLPGQGALFPNPSVSGAFNCTVWPEGALPTVANAEIVRVTARAGDVLTIARAQEGSIAQPITAGMAIAATITSKSLTDLEAVLNGGSIPAIGNSTPISYQGLWPAPYLFPLAKDVVTETTFQSGHGFTQPGGGTGTLADDTGTYLIGNQALKLTSDGVGPATFVAARKTGMAALNATGKYLCVSVMFDHPELLAGVRVDVSSDAFTNWSTSTHVSQASNVSAPYFIPNSWVNLLIPLGAFSTGGGAGATMSALTGFQFRFSDNGGGVINGWINKISTVTAPSNGVVSVILDDGFASAFTQAKPYMDTYGFKGTFGPIVSLVGAGNYMTIAQMQELRDDGWDPVVHAYDGVVHDNFSIQSDSSIEADAQQAKAWMRANGLGPADNILVPQGQLFGSDTNDGRFQIWRRYFQTARGTNNAVVETYPPARRMGMRAWLHSTGTSVASTNAKIDEAVANNEWLQLTFHNLVASSPVNPACLISDFQSIMDHLNSSGALVRPTSDVVRLGLNPNATIVQSVAAADTSIAIGGTASAPTVGAGFLDRLNNALGYKGTAPGNSATTTASSSPTSQIPYVMPVWIPNGTVITGAVLRVVIAAAGLAPVGFQVGLCTSAGKMVAQCANVGAGAGVPFAAAGETPIPFSATYTTNLTDAPVGLYYVVILLNGAWQTTNVTFARWGSLAAPAALPGFTLPYATAGSAVASLPANASSLAAFSAANTLTFWANVY